MKGIACTILFALFSMSLFAAPPDKTAICHHDYEGGFWTPISLVDKAINAHFSKHDDGYPDGTTSVTGTYLDENCEVVTCPCFSYHEAMDFASLPPIGCVIEERPDFAHIWYETEEGYMTVSRGTVFAWCELWHVPGPGISAEGSRRDFAGCFSIAQGAINDGGYSALCLYFP